VATVLRHFVAYNEIATLNVGGRARIRMQPPFALHPARTRSSAQEAERLLLDLFNLYVTNMAVDIRRMGKAELDELNRSAREWRERNKPAQAAKDAIPETSQADDPRETKTPPSTVGEQIELL
jgi:hypothetical protein